MPSTKLIKQRIKSVKNTAQITKAMEVVSATKMRKSQEFAIRARPYAVASLEMLRNLLLRTSSLPSLLQERPVEKSLLFVVTSDKGLAGAFNANVLKKAESVLSRLNLTSENRAVMAIGKKARDYFERRGIFPVKSFWGFGDFSTLDETRLVANEILDGFISRQWDAVDAVYTHFRTTLRQETILKRILPVTREGIEDIVASILPERGKYAESGIGNKELGKYAYEYKFEPSPAEILNMLVPQLMRMHIHHIILESNASEHSARMVAMKSASDNARDLIGELTLAFNKSRQSGITRELAEITAGSEALAQ